MPKSQPSSMLDSLKARISSTGPVTIADYMTDCLMHPRFGYYQQQTVFGKKGDFTTAPEVSNIFGDMIGLWLMDRWQALGAPKTINLIELGPGRGTLMADIINIARQQQAFKSALRVHFVETSVQLRGEQGKKVPDATWHDDLSTLADGPSLFIANEFFDALPIHQFVRQTGNWMEKRVTIEANQLHYCLSAPSPAVSLIPAHLDRQAKDGDHAEVCPAALSATGIICDHLTRHSGAALFIDYGYDRATLGDSFQALRNHQYADPLQDPGSADLTAHVNFGALKAVAGEKGLSTSQVTEQGPFLMTLGAGQRAMQLAKGQSQARQAEILTALKRLTAPEEMGKLFKALSVQSTHLLPPPGF